MRSSQVAVGEGRSGRRNSVAEEGSEVERHRPAEGAGGQVMWGLKEVVRTLTWGPGTHVLEFARSASSPPRLSRGAPPVTALAPHRQEHLLWSGPPLPRPTLRFSKTGRGGIASLQHCRPSSPEYEPISLSVLYFSLWGKGVKKQQQCGSF